jgi:hypothetical protein
VVHSNKWRETWILWSKIKPSFVIFFYINYLL